MDNECTGGRMKNISYLKSEVGAWNKRRNKDRCKIDWRFTKEKADEKLSKYYTQKWQYSNLNRLSDN